MGMLDESTAAEIGHNAKVGTSLAGDRAKVLHRAVERVRAVLDANSDPPQEDTDSDPEFNHDMRHHR